MIPGYKIFRDSLRWFRLTGAGHVYWNDRIDLPGDMIYEYGVEVE